jgi:non-specific serine/threonine protein kinase
MMLETIREFGREQSAAREEEGAIQRQHAGFFLALVEACVGNDQLEAEHGNLRAAHECFVERADTAAGLRLGARLRKFWGEQGYLSEGRERLARLLTLPWGPEHRAVRVRALLAGAELAFRQSDFRAARLLFEECVALYSELGDNAGVTWSYFWLAIVAREQGEYARARSLYAQVAAQAKQAGNKGLHANSLYGLGYVAYLEGDLASAHALLEEALVTHRERRDKFHIGWILVHLAEVADARGDHQAACRFLEENLTLQPDLDDEWGLAYSMQILGRVALHHGERSTARSHFSESLSIWRKPGVKRWIAECLEGLGRVAAEEEDPAQAVRLFGAAELLREATGSPMPPVLRADFDSYVVAAQASLGETAFKAAWAEGRAMTLEQAIETALEGSRG